MSASSDSESEEETSQGQKPVSTGIKSEKESASSGTGSSGTSGSSSADEEPKARQQTAPVAKNRQPAAQTKPANKHDISDSDSSSDSQSGSSRSSSISRADSKDKKAEVTFSDSACESETVNQQVKAIISNLDSPRAKRKKNKSSNSSSVSSFNLSGMNFSPLKTPAPSVSALDSSAFGGDTAVPLKRKLDSIEEDSGSEGDMFESPKKKTKQEVKKLFEKEESLKFECPADFREVMFDDDSVWREDTEDKELWLIKAPIDFDPTLLQNKNPLSIGKVLKKETTKDGETLVWKTRIFHDNGKRVNGCSVVMPSKHANRLKYAGEFCGELHVFKSFDTRPYVIPESTKLPPRIPEGLRMRHVPFGSGQCYGRDAAELGDAEESLELNESIVDTAKTKKKKKKKKKVDVEKEIAEDFDLNLESNTPIIETDETNQGSVGKNKKKKKKAKPEPVEPEKTVKDIAKKKAKKKKKKKEKE